MTRDDIVSMVQEVIITNSNRNPLDFRLTTLEQIEHFAALVATAEREQCATIAKDWDKDHPNTNYGGCIAVAIRARSES
jgi:hypothetical protein